MGYFVFLRRQPKVAICSASDESIPSNFPIVPQNSEGTQLLSRTSIALSFFDASE